MSQNKINKIPFYKVESFEKPFEIRNMNTLKHERESKLSNPGFKLL